jgi:NitT/TauT family transport system permease protein
LQATEAPIGGARDPAGAPAPSAPGGSRSKRVARAILTRVAALAIFILAWQVVVWTGWKPEYLIPSPFTVFDAMWHGPGAFTHNVGVTFGRAGIGFGSALVVGAVLGIAAAVVAPLRGPVRSIAKGLATLPPVVWFPAAMIVIGLSTPAILLVMVIGGAPPVARGVIDGVEATASRRKETAERGDAAGARLRRVVIPGALPDMLGGVRRSWGLCWTALLTGEVLLTLTSLGIGGQLVFEGGLNDYVALYEAMVVIFLMGVVVDGAIGAGSSLLLGRRGPAR